MSRLLVHASPNVTLSVYSHQLPNDLDDVAARLDAAAASVRGTHEGLNVVALEPERVRRTGLELRGSRTQLRQLRGVPPRAERSIAALVADR